jgi:hypothetical protein
MPLNNLITFRKGTESEWNNANPILDNGEPGWDLSNNIFKIGDGVHPWNQLGSLNSKTVKGSFLLNQPSGSFVVTEGYSVGALDVFLNGVKLSPSGDYSASNGTSFTLTDLAPSGSIVEYLALSPGIIPPPSLGNVIEQYSDFSFFPASGDANIIYLEVDEGRFYKWNGTVYYEIGPEAPDMVDHGVSHQSNGSDPIPLVEYSVPQLTANTNNLNHTDKDVLYLDADSNNRELSGLTSPSFCTTKSLINISSTNTIVLKNQSSNSDPSNRFLIYTGSDYSLLPLRSINILYDTNASRWRLL